MGEGAKRVTTGSVIKTGEKPKRRTGRARVSYVLQSWDSDERTAIPILIQVVYRNPLTDSYGHARSFYLPHYDMDRSTPQTRRAFIARVRTAISGS